MCENLRKANEDWTEHLKSAPVEVKRCESAYDKALIKLLRHSHACGICREEQGICSMCRRADISERSDAIVVLKEKAGRQSGR